MKTWITILCMSVMFFSVGHYAAASTYFPDDPAATDDLHGSSFQTYGMRVDQSGDTFTIDLYTDFGGYRTTPMDTNGDNIGDVTWRIYYADLLFDTSMPTLTKNADKSWNMTNFNPDFGVVFALDLGGKNGTNPDPLTDLTVGFYQISSTLTANDYADSYAATSIYNPTYDFPTDRYNQDYLVKIESGVKIGDITVSTVTPGSPGNYKIEISFSITDPTVLAAFTDGFTAFWGTGTCGNDGVTAEVPVPPSLLLMGSGLLSMMGFTAARRFRGGRSLRKKG